MLRQARFRGAVLSKGTVRGGVSFFGIFNGQDSEVWCLSRRRCSVLGLAA